MKCDWDKIGEVYVMESYGMLYGTDEEQNQLAHFMLDVKYNCGMKIKNTSGTVWSVKDCLKHFGFKNVYHDYATFGGSKHDNKHLNSAVNMIKNGRPVIMLGYCIAFNRKDCGHAYVLDGYKKDSTGEYLHINWGWAGVQDGYYAKGCFDEPARTSIEDNFDSGDVSTEKPSKYNCFHYYVHYEY